MLLDKLEKLIWVFGALVVCAVVILMVYMRKSLIHTSEITITDTKIDLQPQENSREKHNPGESGTPQSQPTAPSSNSSTQPSNIVVLKQQPSKKILPAHAVVQDRKIDPLFREKYSHHYADVYEEMQNADSEIVDTPWGKGVRLTFVMKGSIIERMGVEQGDILMGINGITLESFGGSAGDIYKEGERLYDELKRQELFELEVIRNGQPTLLRYYIPLK